MKSHKRKLIIIGIAGIITLAVVLVISAQQGWFGGSSAVPSDTFTRGLVGYWSFDEGSGQYAYDASEYSNDGTLGTSTAADAADPQWTTGKVGGALDFDGETDYVDCGNDPSLTPDEELTVEVWVKPSSTQNAYTAIVGNQNDVSGWLLRYYWGTGNRLHTRIGNGSTCQDFESNSSTTPNEWTHVVFTFVGGGNGIFYFNGVAESPITATINSIAYLSDTVCIAAENTLTVDRFFNGIIDEVRVYNRALSAEEVRYHYNRGGPVGYWSFDEGNGTTTYDATPNNNDGTLGDGSCSPGSGTCPSWTTGKYGSALTFDGTDDYVSVGDVYNGVKTISFWLKPDDITDRKILDLDGGTHYIEIDSSSQIQAQGFSSPTIYIDGRESGSPLIDIRWHHVAVVTDTGINASSTDIGKVGSNYFDGILDDVRIYNYARTPEEIRLDYNAGLAAKLGGSPDPIFKSNLLPLWKYRKKIAIDKNKIDEDLTDFPVLVKLTSSNFDFSKAKSDGYDIRFTDADDNQLLKYERERHSTSTEQAEYWVRIPDISSTGNTSFYMYYGNSDASDSEDAENVWDGNFVMVQHMDDETTSTTTDSTSHNNDGTKNAANEPIEVDAKIGKGQDGDGYDDHINCGTDSSFDDIRHVSFWFNSEASSNQEGLMSYHAANTDRWVILGYHSCCNSPNVFVGSEDSFIIEANSSHAGDGTWHRLDLEWDGSTTTMYIDGDAQTQTSSINPFADGGGGILYLGTYRYDEWIDNAFEGKYDEYRVSTTNRGAAWIKSSYYSGNDDLLTFGDEETNTMPVGHWKFDEGSGSIAFDATDNNNDGTLNLGTQGTTATSAAWVTGKYGSALSFDGTDDYVVVADDSSLDITENLTISAWAKFSNVDGPEQGIVGKCEDYASFSLRLNHLNTGDKKVGIKIEKSLNDQYLIESTTLVENNKWYHIVAVKEGSSYLKLYLNGGLENSMTDVFMATNSYNLFIGGDPKGTAPGELDYPFNGIIDDVRIYNYARTDEQIKMDYNAGLAAHFGPSSSCDKDPGACMTLGLVGYWNFEEGSGQIAYDMSDYSNDGRLGTSTAADAADPQWTTGKKGGALDFDGDDDHINFGHDSSLNASVITVEAWLRADQDDDEDIYISKGDNKVDGWYFWCESLTWELTINKSGTDQKIDPSISVTLDTWTHLVGVIDSTALKVYWYKDGVYQTTSDMSWAFVANEARDLSIGDYLPSPAAWFSFHGKLDEVRIYNRVLSAEEVRYHYNRGGPVGYWSFNEGEGSTAYDSTDNDNDGTLNLGTQGNTATSAAWVTGKYGTALKFDGEDDYVQIEDDSTLRMTTALTMEAWIKIPSGVTGDRAVMGGQGDANWSQGYDLYYEATENVLRMRLGYGDGSQEGYLYNYYVTSSVDLEDNAWHHVAGTFDEPYASLYVDGVQVARGVNNNDVTYKWEPVNIGARGISPSWEYNYFRGLIDDARFYNYARTAEQIRLDYNAGLGIHFK